MENTLTGYASISKPWMKYYSEEVINMKLPEATIYSYLKEKNKENYNKTAIEYFGNTYTYSELISKIDQCAESLCALGVKTGDIVSICMPTTPEFVFLFYALSKIGAISNMIDPRKSAKEIEEYIREVDSKLFFCIDVIHDKIGNLDSCDTISKIIVLTVYESFKQPLKQILKIKDSLGKKKIKLVKEISWNSFLTNEGTTYEATYVKNTPVTIVRTGGTTGKSKGVVLSNDNINCGAFQCEYSGLDFKDKGTWLDIMPPFIVYGVGNGLHLPLSMGMKVILMPKFDPTQFDKILLKHKPNYMAGVPSHWGYIVNSKMLDGVDLSFIKTPIVGGDKMDYTLEEKVNEFLTKHNCKTKIIKGYGMSEVDAAVSVCTTNKTNKLKSVGIPLPHSVIEIVDPENDVILGPNEVGEVRISGPNVMLGYYKNEGETEGIMRESSDGIKWIYSGDMGYMDEDGMLFVLGRYKEMIIRPDGFKVYPSSIEEVILKNPSVSECKVVGIRDNKESQGEVPKAFIILKAENADSNITKIKNEIKNLCEKELAEYSLPVAYEILDTFPVTAIGKIDTLKLKEM